MKLKHSHKVSMARKMRTHEELKKRVGIFQSKAWTARRTALAARLNPPVPFFAPVIHRRTHTPESWWKRLLRFLWPF